MKKYELKYTKGEAGVFRMSTVESPATKTMLVMFDDELKAMEFSDDEKQIIYSVAMRPNMLIPRKDVDGEPAMVFYSEDTVNDLQQNFFKNNSHNGGTVNHDGKARTDMYCFESWIVSDPEKDKATSLGLQVQKGDWILGQKIDNAEVWNDVKSGKLQGFSIEAYLEPVLINNKIEMTQEEIDARIKVILMESEEEKKAAELEAERIKMEEEAKADPAPEVPTVEELQKTIADLTEENLELKTKLAEKEGEVVEMSAQVIASKKVLTEMSAEMAKGIKPNAVVKSFADMTPLEKFRQSKTQ